MKPGIRFLYTIAVMSLISAPTGGNPHLQAGFAVICAAVAFLWDSTSYYLKREGRE